MLYTLIALGLIFSFVAGTAFEEWIICRKRKVAR